MLRVVFDTVVFVRCLINPYSLWGKLVFSYYNRYQLFLSKPILTEIIEVLNRPEITSKFRSFNKMDFGQLLEILGEAPIVEIPSFPSISRDPEDDKFLATAIAAQVDYLVTEDKDLLTIKDYQEVRIVNARKFLDVLKQI